MSLFHKIELLERERKLRLTYSLGSNMTNILIVDIDQLFDDMLNEEKSRDLLNELLGRNKKLIN